MGQSPSQRVCSNCGTLNTLKDEYCANCGFSLDSPATVTMASPLNAPTLASTPGRRITGTLTTGELLGTRYRIIQLLGKGGFGAVYQANDERFQGRRRVAIKEMSDAHLGPAERARAIANFRQEADILVQLKHANLPDVSDFLEEGGKAYLVMEFIDGSTLEKIQDDAGGPLDESLVMGWALQLCDVLDYLHNQPQPIIFRDLKPPNMMLTRSNQIKLIDFGIARMFKSSSTKDTDTLGSQGYAPLEQYGRGQSDARTDIYALGATLYDLLTNTVPLAAPMRRITPQALLNPRQFNPRLSFGTEQVILKAMEELPDQRYPSAAEMFQAISNLGFSIARNTGGIPALTASGPNAPTFAATQPGTSLGLATLNQQPTQISTPPVLGRSTQPGMPTVAVPPTQPGMPSIPAAPTRQHAQASPAGTLQGSQTMVAPTQAGQAVQSFPGVPTSSAPGGPYQATTSSPTAPPQPVPGTSFPNQPPASQQRLSRRAVLIGGGAIALVAAGIYAYSRVSSSPRGGATGGTIPITFAYSTEKADWLRAALAAFQGSNPTLNNKTIQVQLTDLGSLDGQNQIISGQLQPTAWSPASNLEINRLNYLWQQNHAGNSIIDYTEQFQPRSLVKSPLVLAAWQKRAELLLSHYNVPTLDWPTLASAFSVQNWSEVGGQQTWGPVKFGHTLPNQSNSGLLTITLLAYNHFQEERGLTSAQVNDTGYWSYLQTFENAVNAFGHSSGTYLTNDVINGAGPAQADVIATYESLVLTSQAQARSQQGQPLLIYYPAVNILSDHPFVVLQGKWVTDEQKQAALHFRDFLLAPEQQHLAVSYGFRPGNSTVSLTDPGAANNPFISLASLFPNRHPDPLQALAQAPDGNIVNALINGWSQRNPNPRTTDG